MSSTPQVTLPTPPLAASPKKGPPAAANGGAAPTTPTAVASDGGKGEGEGAAVPSFSNAFITYLPCIVTRGANPEALAKAGGTCLDVSKINLGWVEHRDLTAMGSDFWLLDKFVRAKLPENAPAHNWMLSELPTAVETTASNRADLERLIRTGCKHKWSGFFGLLGHGLRESGGLVVQKKYRDEMISPADVVDFIRGSESVVCILVDSCYSGHWVSTFENETAINANVVVQSSCGENEDASGGLFTPIWHRLQTASEAELQKLIEAFKSWEKEPLVDAPVSAIQKPCFFTNIKLNVDSSSPVVELGGLKWIAKPRFFEFLCREYDADLLPRAYIKNEEGEKLLEELVRKESRFKLLDFKLFKMQKKKNEYILSALFSGDDKKIPAKENTLAKDETLAKEDTPIKDMYILHAHYCHVEETKKMVIEGTCTVFGARHPVQDKSHLDFTGWNAVRWGNESPEIYKENRPETEKEKKNNPLKPGKYLKDKLDLRNSLDELLRNFVNEAYKEACQKANVKANEKANEKANVEANEKANVEANEKANVEANEKANVEANEKANEKANVEANEETSNENCFDNSSNWSMPKGFYQRMRSRALMADSCGLRAPVTPNTSK